MRSPLQVVNTAQKGVFVLIITIYGGKYEKNCK